MKASLIDFPCYTGNQTYIESLSYNLDELKIIVVADSAIRIEVIFYQPIGFRCLDEGDMLEYWENPEVTKNWILQIHDSGWLSQESMRNGFLSKSSEVKEYLIKGLNDCVSVLDSDCPSVKLL
ncbi:hypothetical protein L2755_14425 [Shewanella abyssi]|uniref:hypothetical protein n=1 Tax=Shewanella abyssi TaxID=311789 RepID=UPI00200EB41D|nr:hypothetical protein [Shewanella abyssi]MCL1050810.1 hypothetical protein [Shewanella abyssi]